MPHHCTKLPHDLQVSQKLARWFGPALQLLVRGQRRGGQQAPHQKMENVSVEFKDDTYGVTRGTFVAEADTYGADKFWVVLNPIPIKSRSTWRRTRVMSSLARLRPQPASQPASQPTCHALDHALVPGVSQARSLSVGRGQV